jgi:hypothetical protein
VLKSLLSKFPIVRPATRPRTIFASSLSIFVVFDTIARSTWGRMRFQASVETVAIWSRICCCTPGSNFVNSARAALLNSAIRCWASRLVKTSRRCDTGSIKAPVRILIAGLRDRSRPCRRVPASGNALEGLHQGEIDWTPWSASHCLSPPRSPNSRSLSHSEFGNWKQWRRFQTKLKPGLNSSDPSEVVTKLLTRSLGKR